MLILDRLKVVFIWEFCYISFLKAIKQKYAHGEINILHFETKKMKFYIFFLYVNCNARKVINYCGYFILTLLWRR